MLNEKSIAVQDPLELRMSLLISALHYSWKTREGRSFHPTYLFHKIECIGLAKGRLNSLKTSEVSTTVRLISTLCVVESGFGNLAAARVHLDGLMAILDLVEEQGYFFGFRQAVHGDLITRYIALAHEFVYTTTGFLHPRIKRMAEYIWGDPSIEQKNGIRMDGLRLIPYFDGSQKHTDEGQRQANISYDFASLKMLMPLVRERYCRRLLYFMGEFLNTDNPPGQTPEHLVNIKEFLSEASEIELRAGRNTVARSMGSFFWSSIASAGSMYVNNVAADLPANDCKVYGQLYLRLIRDINSTEFALIAGGNEHRIWLWKVFTGAYTIARTQAAIEEARGRPEDDTSVFRTLRRWFGQRIQSWSRATHVTAWKDAEKTLFTVGWPKDSPGAGLSEKLWQEAVWGNMNMELFVVDALLIR